MKFLGTGLTLTALALLSACSSARHDGETANDEGVLGATASAIQGGTVDQGHPFAVGVCGTKRGGSRGDCSTFCSGALIAPNLVVTARHCVSDSPEMIDCTTASFGALSDTAAGFFVTTNSSMYQASLGWHSVSKIVTTPGTKVCGNDLAMLILNDNVSAAEATPVIPIVQYSMTDHDRYSTSQTAIGYGISAPNTNTQGTRRIRQNIGITCIPGDKNPAINCGNTAAELAQRNMSDKEFEAGDGTCSGDSGSSAYEQSSFATAPSSFGVLSRGGTVGDTCTGAIYTRLDKWRDLIVSTVTEASTKGGYPLPAWTVFVPPVEPPPDAGPMPAADAGVSTEPVPAAIGAVCAGDEDCASKSCAAPLAGAPFVCTAACDATKACSKGYACKQGLCFAGAEETPDAAPALATPASTTTTTTGCSVHRANPTPVPWRHLALGLVAVVAAVRRRRATRASRKNAQPPATA